jgi:hypothetical protein
MIWIKKLLVPFTNQTKMVDAVQLWEVRWNSRHGEYSGDIKKEAEFFPSEDDAIQFKNALVSAFKLTRNTSVETKVSICMRIDE